jgi:hypothetical protein
LALSVDTQCGDVQAEVTVIDATTPTAFQVLSGAALALVSIPRTNLVCHAPGVDRSEADFLPCAVTTFADVAWAFDEKSVGEAFCAGPASLCTPPPGGVFRPGIARVKATCNEEGKHPSLHD